MVSPILPIIGSVEYVKISGEDAEIPAKTDTGADFSAIWASDFKIEEDGKLSFVFFDKESELYTGKRHFVTDFEASSVRSSNGQSQVRYRVPLEMTLGGETFTAEFNLSDRSKGRFPILIGRYAIKNRFLVDVAHEAFARPENHAKSLALTEELKQNPQAFHDKYMNN